MRHFGTGERAIRKAWTTVRSCAGTRARPMLRVRRRPPAPARSGARRPILAAETLRPYAADWARFAEYCASGGAPSLPAEAATVAAFLAAPGPGRAARARRLAAIDHRHRQHALPSPATIRACAPR